MSRVYYGWWIAVIAFITLLVTVGIPFYGLPFFYDYFQHDFGWSRAQVTSGIGVATILALPIGGLIIPRYPPKQLLLAGIVLLSISMAGFATMHGSAVLYFLIWMVFMTGYLCAGPIPHQVLISNWFVKKRGTAMALAYLGLGVGGAISQKYVALPLIRSLGWRGALLAIGASLLLLIPLVLCGVRNRPDNMSLLPYVGHESGRSPPLGLAPILHAAPFWLLAFGSFASIGSIGSVNQHLKLLFLDAGLQAERAADTTFVMLMSSLAGRAVMGWLADSIPKKYVMVWAYLLIALSLPLLFFVGRSGVAMVFGGVFGFGLGADYMLIPLMAADLFGTGSLARVMGILLPADSIAQTVCPLLVGLLFAQTGNYGLAVIFLSVLAAAGATAICFLPGRKGYQIAPLSEDT